VRRATLFLLAMLSLAACGKKGDPDPPQPDQFPHQYPKQEILPETGGYGQVPGTPPPRPMSPNPIYPSYP